MVDEKRLRAMIDLARFEQIEGKEDLRICNFYKSDFVTLAVIKNFFLMTLGYFMVLAAIGIFFLDYLMDNFKYINTNNLLILVVGGYLVVLGVYTIIEIIIALVRYSRALDAVDEFDDKLKDLGLAYQGKTRKPQKTQEKRNKK